VLELENDAVTSKFNNFEKELDLLKPVEGKKVFDFEKLEDLGKLDDELKAKEPEKEELGLKPKVFEKEFDRLKLFEAEKAFDFVKT
jgi:hypothetical protein